MSKLSEFWRWLTNNPKVPTLIQAKTIQCFALEVIGKNGKVEIHESKDGIMGFVISDGTRPLKNAVAISFKPNKEINIDVIGPDGAVTWGVDQAPDGTIQTRP